MPAVKVPPNGPFHFSFGGGSVVCAGPWPGVGAVCACCLVGSIVAVAGDVEAPGLGLHAYDRDALAEVAGHVITLAEAEDLPGHGQAVSIRFQR